MKRSFSVVPLMALGLLLPLVLLEIALRLLFPDAPIRRYDPVLGGVPRPYLNVRTTYGFYESVVRVRTDSSGFREAPTLPRSDFNASRILALGDSFTFGDEVEAQDTWPSQLQGFLNDSKKPYSVINAGVSDFGTAQELLLYRQLHARLKPRIVILGIFVGNDILDNLCLEDGTLAARTDIPCYTLSGRDLVLHPPRRAANVDVGSPFGLISNLLVERLLSFEARRATVWNPGFLRAAGALGIHFSLANRQGFIESWYDEHYFLPGWKVTSRLIEQLKDEVEANGASLVLLIIPDPLQVVPQLRLTHSMMSGDDLAMRAFLKDDARPQRLLLRLCQQIKMECIDPLAEICLAQNQGKQVYYRINGHWTGLSDQIAARQVAARIEPTARLVTSAQ